MKFKTLTDMHNATIASCAVILFTFTCNGLHANETTSSLAPDELFQQARKIVKDPAAKARLPEAYELMKKAAGAGNAEALGGLGVFYAQGVVVAKDETLAVDFFRKAAEKNAPLAQLNYGRMLATGRGITKDETAGFTWIQKAADQSLPEAWNEIGNLAFEGKWGQSQSNSTAFTAHLRAAEMGLADSENFVGIAYRDGIGTEIDAKKAEGWFRKAAIKGHAKSQSNLGHLLGFDAAHRVEALKWLFLAKAQNEILAERTLLEVLPSLPKEDVEKAQAAQAAFVAR